MKSATIATLLVTASIATLSAPAVAQTAPSTPASAPDDTGAIDDPANTIVVTGTRAANRTLGDSPVPVDVISADALAASGLGETAKILN